MSRQKSLQSPILNLLVFLILTFLQPGNAEASDLQQVTPGNFGLPGIIDLPTAKKCNDGELIITQQLHKS